MRRQNGRRTDLATFCNLLLLVLLQILSVVIGTNSDDISNIWYFGCRWFGGSENKMACNCSSEAKEMYIQRDSIQGFESALEIHNCPKVRFGGYSIYDLRTFRSITLTNIQNLTFEPNSLNWVGYRDISINQQERFDLSIPSLKIHIINSNIDSIGSYTFVGRIQEIHMEKVNIASIEAFAFSNILQMENLIFKEVVLRDVKPQAFKMFGTESLIFDGVTAQQLPSRTFSNVTVYRRFLISNCNFDILRPATFIINNPASFVVTDTRINQLEGEAFYLTTTGDVLFRNNYFDQIYNQAFMGITLNTQEVTSGRAISFDSNTFGSLRKYSLDVQPQFQARVSNLYLNQTCDCESIVVNVSNSDFYNEIKCVDYEGKYVTMRDFKSYNCSILAGYYPILIGVSIVILLLGILAIAFYLYYVMVYKRDKYGCKRVHGKPNLSLIVPDGKTYRETELHVIVEKADLLTTDL
ncbi:uncharacterized protein LOC126739412 [Anthonomus grandis grandis]|uniref:uncharacterized protein LOC126739412 n=1 Tax=Anthonomus grandis grandis TaxID=2921223 RepID=UPI002165F813|nr:uncharacterized protein LOC126739412 [Anthonomus grandis grandis]XP_050301044.1 uncharacterized protein LOC126739412 [Anthonomus grandis grandis]XP_050301045.1 uncharacterized protein LOC126739412 [Anthonomus grandis grandis]XP_050301046.1 uncharacterized protein LOC126739412 [Anthonomus grandis grandis]XP_050301047.1 uncharacterized protein LOC126739412 [Anthonomus grandis grandis]